MQLDQFPKMCLNRLHSKSQGRFAGGRRQWRRLAPVPNTGYPEPVTFSHAACHRRRVFVTRMKHIKQSLKAEALRVL